MGEYPLRILMVDDDQDDYILTRDLLSEIVGMKCDLDWVASYDAAVELMGRHEHAVYLLDYQLGGGDGLELLHEAIANGCKAPIILLTGQGNDEVDRAAMNGGAADYLVKGQINPPLLERCIRHAIERSRTEEAVRESNRRLSEVIEELKATQQKLLQQERLRTLGQLAIGVAHELNNALTPVVGYTSLLLQRPEDLANKRKVMRYLLLILTAAKDAANIVKHLREFYGPREARETLHPVSINQLIKQAILAMRPRWKNEAQADGITINVETDLREVPTVTGNEAELREVFTNLIFNAIDAMPMGGTITIRTRVEGAEALEYASMGGGTRPGPNPQTPKHVAVEMSDTGTGMTEEVRQRCLEPFFTTKGDRGTGLGLAAVQGIIRRHEGTVEVESQPGTGTTFILRLPMRQAQPDVAKQEAQQEKVPALRSLQVLVVEDDALVRDLLVEYLKGDGHTVGTAANGREGLERFYSGSFDVIVTDLSMPKMSGDQLAKAIKKIAPEKPVIMLTGFGDFMNGTDEHFEGVDALVSKPPTPTALRKAIEQALEMH